MLRLFIFSCFNSRHEINKVTYGCLVILIVPLYYSFKKDESYFQLFMLVDKLNLGLVLKFKEKAS